ncbi:MAG: hypothetical protein HC880_02425 [Bacteroidia bacterium]|nr:hypothetical protein [Bacteroidia bacterium]
MLVRFREDVINLKPKAVVILAGTNDIAENTGSYDPDFTFGNITSMVKLAQANNIKVVLASVLPASAFRWRTSVQDVPNKIMQLNERLKNYAREQKLVYLDYHSALKNDQNGLSEDMAPDGVHPTPAAYKIMASLAQEALRKVLK